MKPTLTTRTSQKLVSKEAPSERFLEVSIDTPEKETSNRSPLNLAIVIDRSGSMHGDKLTRAKQAAEYVLDRLTERDRVSLVIYDSVVDTIAPSDLATTNHIRRCKSALREVFPGGTTALFDGWATGCDQIADFIQPGSLPDEAPNGSGRRLVASRVLLLTDGLANVGLTDSPAICEHVSALFERGISTSTFGIGADFDEDLLSDMADAGRGRFYYIEHAGLIPDAFRQEFGDLASVVASNATLTLELRSDIGAKLLGGIPHESDEQRIVIPIGDLYQGESRPYYFRLDVPAARDLATAELLTSMNMGNGDSKTTVDQPVSFEYASAEDVALERVDKELMRRVADVDIAQTRIEAMNLNRAGRYTAANLAVCQTAASYGEYRDPHDLAADYEFAENLRAPLDPVARKMRKLDALRRSRVRR